MSCLDAIFEPIVRIAAAGGPTKMMPAAAQASAKRSFSDRNPYPGCIAAAPAAWRRRLFCRHPGNFPSLEPVQATRHHQPWQHATHYGQLRIDRDRTQTQASGGAEYATGNFTSLLLIKNQTWSHPEYAEAGLRPLGARVAYDIARPSTARVSAGSITPSSHKRADA